MKTESRLTLLGAAMAGVASVAMLVSMCNEHNARTRARGTAPLAKRGEMERASERQKNGKNPDTHRTRPEATSPGVDQREPVAEDSRLHPASEKPFSEYTREELNEAGMTGWALYTSKQGSQWYASYLEVHRAGHPEVAGRMRELAMALWASARPGVNVDEAGLLSRERELLSELEGMSLGGTLTDALERMADNHSSPNYPSVAEKIADEPFEDRVPDLPGEEEADKQRAMASFRSAQGVPMVNEESAGLVNNVAVQVSVEDDHVPATGELPHPPLESSEVNPEEDLGPPAHERTPTRDEILEP